MECPHCKKELKTITYIKDEGYEIWEYPITKGKLDGNKADIIKSDFTNCYYECPECEKWIDSDKVPEIV